jgi:hypothetical protein
MDKNPCAETYAEIEGLIQANPSSLCWNIARQLADYTVAFVALRDGKMGSGAVGTLVSFQNEYYILTAAHVWEFLKRGDAIRIPLKENTPCRFAISPTELVPFVIASGWWNRWGPDLALLQLRPEHVGSFVAVGRSFFPLSMKRERRFNCGVLIWFLMGAPAMRGQFTPESAIPELQGMNVVPSTDPYLSVFLQDELRSRFDFVDVDVDTTQPDIASNFEGVSGGGFWRVYIYKDANRQIQSFKILDGVAFWQFRRPSNLTMRCHGPQAIGELLRSLFD